VESAPRAYRLKASNAAPPISTFPGAFPLRSKGETDINKVTAIAAKAPNGGMLANALISSAMTAKRIQSNMKLGTAILDVDFAVPPRVNMK